ncbi:MAG: hypothetical protein H7X95_14415 [Deltaproteobacteria bacterium]|nr:hypothetical protein [Deltaproteobacteria bacterium]
MDQQTGFNPKRRLCVDGACTGIVGPDGRCGECERYAGENVPGPGAADQVDAPPASDIWDVLDASDSPEDRSLSAAAPDAHAAAGTPSGFDPSRRLCKDGTCVGVIGPSGACPVCGRSSQ